MKASMVSMALINGEKQSAWREKKAQLTRRKRKMKGEGLEEMKKYFNLKS